MLKFIVLFLVTTCVFAQNALSFTSKKLDMPLMQEIIKVFGCDTFIETGTFKGKTTALGAQIFKEVHTIEISHDLFRRAKRKFYAQSHVHCYLGDSAEVLPKLLQRCRERNTFLYFDAHYSGDGTKKGVLNTPIIHELTALKKYSPKQFVVVIDDIREFSGLEEAVKVHGGYPVLADLGKKIQQLFPQHAFMILGDIGVIYPADIDVSASEIVQACTRSRMHVPENDVECAIEAEMQLVKLARTREANEIVKLKNRLKKTGPLSARNYLYLWSGLVEWGLGNLEKASYDLTMAIKCHFPHWRVYWYHAQVLKLLGKITAAKNDIKTVRQLAPHFQPARELFNN